ncbi:MAG: Uma2 family endonuclease [Chloroflexota bacterium]|nr:Uma2 family endonuclease [Chloroflexota bacterium]
MTVTEAIKFTYEDYLLMEEEKRYEIIDGRRYMVPAPTPYHQWISARLEDALRTFVEAHDLGLVLDAPCDVVLSPTDIVQPDILFITQERRGIITERNIRGAPDLVVEVLSPSTAQKDRDLKRKLYAAHGVREFWVVSPEAQTVEVLELAEGGYRRVGLYARDESLHSPSFPELVIPLEDVFTEL